MTKNTVLIFYSFRNNRFIMVINDCLTYDIFHSPHKKHSEYRTKADLWLVEDINVYTLHIIKMMKTFRLPFSAADLLTIIIIEHTIERKFKIDKYYEFTYTLLDFVPMWWIILDGNAERMYLMRLQQVVLVLLFHIIIATK